MNKNDLFCHLGKDFKVDWDVESVLSKMNNYIVDETVGPDGEHYPVKNITYPCFQIYPSGVNTSHTFWKFFTDECINICDNLTILKNTIKHENINSVLVAVGDSAEWVIKYIFQYTVYHRVYFRSLILLHF
jgi:hypothetical protein